MPQETQNTASSKMIVLKYFMLTAVSQDYFFLLFFYFKVNWSSAEFVLVDILK